MIGSEFDGTILKSISKHHSTIIWLHGLGETRDGWTEINFNIRQKFPFTKFIFPFAPIRPNGLYGNRELPSWFDISCREKVGLIEDAKGLDESIEIINDIIQDEIQSGITSDNIFIGGFSQGSMTAMMVSLRSELQLGGLICVSGFFNLKEIGVQEFTTISKQTPILLLQGESDKSIHTHIINEVKDVLTSNQYPFQLKTYPNVAHDISDDMVDDIHLFLLQHIINPM